MAVKELLRIFSIPLLILVYGASANSQTDSEQAAASKKLNVVGEKSMQLDVASFEQLRNARISERVEIDLAASAGFAEPLRFQRLDLYAKDTKIIVSDGMSERELVKSGRRFFLAIDRLRSAGFSLDPETGEINGLLVEGSHSYRITNRHESAVKQNEILISNLSDEAAGSVFSCENNNHPEISTHLSRQISSDVLPSLNAMTQGTAVLFEAAIAVDTDNEFLWNKFANNENDALEWIENLFVRLNVIFERDLRLRVLLGTTFLRKDNSPSGNPDFNADPEGFNDDLYQFGDYWGDNQQGVSRVFAALFSGKDISRNSFSGTAWINGYCSNRYGYSYNRIGSNLSASFVAGGVGHEIGHNLGSRHTHCEKLANNGSDYVDTCYAKEDGCFSGSPTCPAGGAGTIMSYCHQTPEGCDNSDLFHPLIIGKLDNRIISNTPGCISELDDTSLILMDGFEQ